MGVSVSPNSNQRDSRLEIISSYSKDWESLEDNTEAEELCTCINCLWGAKVRSGEINMNEYHHPELEYLEEDQEDELVCGTCDEQEEEGIKIKSSSLPCRPSQEEVDNHYLTHIPFRSWCPHCVKGKSMGLPHHKSGGKDLDQVPVVNIDYMFMGDNQDREAETGAPILIMRDRRSKTIKANIVPAKGADNYASTVLGNNIERLGYKKIILKSDGENAIKALKNSAKRESDVEIIMEESPSYDSKSNGEIEQTNQIVQGQFRTFKDALESRYETRIDGSHQCVPWLMTHSAETINRFQIGSDGRTALIRSRGKSFRRPIAEFGECILYLKAKSLGRDKFQCRWAEGVFYGIRDQTSEIIVGTPEGTIRARDFRRRGSQAERWNITFFNRCKGAPWQPIPGRSDPHIHISVNLPSEKSATSPIISGEKSHPIRRRFRIQESDFAEIGLTRNCPGCIAINRGFSGQQQSPKHNETCRSRVENHLKLIGDPRIERESTRTAEEVTDRLDAQIKESNSESSGLEKKRSRAASREPSGNNAESRMDIDHEDGSPFVEASGSSESNEQHRLKKMKVGEEDEKLNEEANQVIQSQMEASEKSNSDASMNSVLMADCRDQGRWICSMGLNHEAPIKRFWDNISGAELDPSLVLEARAEEIKEILKYNVYTKVPISQCWNQTNKRPIGTRWVDINKGDSENPEYRSRIVAQEFNDHKREDLFAGTPPLEAIKILISAAVTEGVGYKRGDRINGFKLDFIDVRRAYYQARAKREVYVSLPEGDQEEGMCGLLSQSLQGTRDAAQNWEEEYSSYVISLGFARGKSTPCIFYHKARNVRLSVHGDDFTLLGSDKELDWFRSAISKKFDVKFRGRLGPGSDDLKSIKVLNRIIEWTSAGITFEADQRHAEIIVESLGLGKESKPISTPGTSEPIKDESEIELSAQNQTLYRAIGARANYMSQDRSDTKFASKEISKSMAKPTNHDWSRLIRFGRYLIGRERVVLMFNYQTWDGNVIIWSDSDWAGDKVNRKSTSGGIVLLGKHPIKAWASTQPKIATSSGEAEYYAIVKASSEGLGIRSMLQDWEITATVKVQSELKEIDINTDSSAAKSIASRRGLGKIRHMDTYHLWVQECVCDGRIKVHKVKGTDNLADALTKHIDQHDMNYHMLHTNQFFVRGRHALTPTVVHQ